MNSLRCKIRKIDASGALYSFPGTHLDLSTLHLNSFLLILVNPSIESPCCTAQIRLSGHYRDLYIKKNYFFEDFCILFFYLFSTAWGESWRTVNLIWFCCQQIYFGFPVRTYVPRDSPLPSDQYCTQAHVFLQPNLPFFLKQIPGLLCDYL